MLHTVGEMRLLSNYVITFITLTYLCAFLFIALVLSGDIETNPVPKPPKFPCWHCKKLVVITKEPCPALSVNRVILGTMQFVSTFIQIFSLCRKGLHVLGNVLTVAYQNFLPLCLIM